MLHRRTIRGIFLGLLLLCGVTWLISYRFAAIFAYEQAGTATRKADRYTLMAGQGYIALERLAEWTQSGHPNWYLRCYQIRNMRSWAFQDAQTHAPWFAYEGLDARVPSRAWMAMPFWFPTALAALTFAFVYWRTAKAKQDATFPIPMRTCWQPYAVRRWTLRGTIVGTLLLCLAVWAWSYNQDNKPWFSAPKGRPGDVWMADVHWGAAHLIQGRPPCAHYAAESCFRGSYEGREFLGFRFWRAPCYPYEGPSLCIAVPLWFPTLVLALAGVWLWRGTRPSPAGRAFPVEMAASKS